MKSEDYKILESDINKLRKNIVTLYDIYHISNLGKLLSIIEKYLQSISSHNLLQNYKNKYEIRFNKYFITIKIKNINVMYLEILELLNTNCNTHYS